MRRLNKVEEVYALSWAKKIKAIKLLGGKCKECLIEDIFVLHFHHSGDDKKHTINNIRNFRWSLIEEEIKKCILLCSNCHSELHVNEEARRYQDRIRKLESMGVSFKDLKCSKCNYRGKNFSSLHFHHMETQNKKFAISDAFNNIINVSVQEIINELSKCKILCGNCHAKEHVDIDKFNYLKPHIYHKVTNYKELPEPYDVDLISDMYFNQGMRQVDIVNYFNCSKGTISGIINKLKSSRQCL